MQEWAGIGADITFAFKWCEASLIDPCEYQVGALASGHAWAEQLAEVKRSIDPDKPYQQRLAFCRRG